MAALNTIPDDATDLHLFAVKPTKDGKYQAFIGFTLPNGNFSFVQIPVDPGIYGTLKL